MADIRILVAEDDPDINGLVAGALRREGFAVECVFDGAEALSRLSSDNYHMVVLDIMMPGADGYEVLRNIREQCSTPVLILSAKSRESDKIMGLGLGADDYLAKPFGVGELVARVRAQLRRSLGYSPDARETRMIRHGGIVMDTQNYEVSAGGKQVTLTAKEFEILKLFMQNPRKVFTKSQLFSSVWGGEYLNDENTVMVHIRRLREKIEDDPGNPRRILTVWGIGYKLADE